MAAPSKSMSTNDKLALGGVLGGIGLTVLGGLFAALGGKKQPTSKPMSKSCGGCGR